MSISKQFTIKNVLKMYDKKELNSLDLIQELYKNHKAHESNNIYISSYFEELLADHSLKNRNVLPISIKDLYFIENKVTTAASRMLKDFVAPCDAEIIRRLRNHDFVFTGKTNLDEFACGSSGKTSAFGQTLSTIKNKHGEVMSPGGSSSGAAVSLLANTCLASMGTDTGGSVRQPAAWTGLVGYKPTYGIFSRYGVIEMAHSLDCPSIFTKTIDDLIYIWERLIGKCSKDLTTVDYDHSTYKNHKKKVGLFIDPSGSKIMHDELQAKAKILESNGYKIVDINLDLLKYCINIYYIICPLEIASNMAKYNGIFYNKNYGDIYLKTRSEGFGSEVKRRILMGNYIGYNIHEDNLYSHAFKLLNKIYNYLLDIFKECDCILMPTYDGVGMTIEETKNPDPIKMYKCDLYTCPINLLGLPAIHVPTNTYEGLPIGVQLFGPAFSDHVLFDIAKLLENKE